MKRKITLSIAFALSLICLLLTNPDSRVAAQNQIRIVADTGMVSLGANQVLRVIMKDGSNGVTLENYVVKRIQYTQGVCSGGICKHTISSQTTSAPIPLAPNESLSADLEWNANAGGTRIVVLSRSQDVQVNVMIINTLTGEVTSQILFDTYEGNAN